MKTVDLLATRHPTEDPSERESVGNLWANEDASCVMGRRSKSGVTMSRDAIWSMVGSVTYTTSQWLTIIAMAWAGGAAMVGRFALAIAIATPVVLLTNLSLSTVYLTDIHGKYRFSEFLGTRLLTCALSLVVIGLLALAAGEDTEQSLLIVLAGVLRCSESISEIINSKQRKDGDFRSVALVQIAASVIQFIVPISVLWLTGSIVASMAALTCAGALRILLMDLPLLSGSGTGWNREWPVFMSPNACRLVAAAAPLGIITAMTSLNANMSRYYIGWCVDSAALGRFSAIFLLASPIALAGASIGSSLSTHLSQAHSRNPAEHYSLIWKLTAISFVFSMLSVFLAYVSRDVVVQMLFGPDYLCDSIVLPIAVSVGGFGLAATFLSIGVSSRGEFWILPISGVCVLAVSALSLGLAVPAYGTHGAAIGTLLAAVAQFLVLAAITLSRQSGSKAGFSAVQTVVQTAVGRSAA